MTDTGSSANGCPFITSQVPHNTGAAAADTVRLSSSDQPDSEHRTDVPSKDDDGGVDPPSGSHVDSTLAMIKNPYHFVAQECDRLGTDLFLTRLLLRKTICMRGKDAAKIFYNESLFLRDSVTPYRVRVTLFGEGGIQGLDDDAHRNRKAMFLALMNPERIDRLVDAVAQLLRSHAQMWASGQDDVVLFDALTEVLTIAVCKWCGVPLPDSDVKRRAEDLTALFDGAGAIGPRHWAARLARGRCNEWITGIIEQLRAGQLKVENDCALHVIAWHRDAVDADLLPSSVAAVELINVLRPVVAIAVWCVHLAHAIERHPQHASLLRQQNAAAAIHYAELFVQEVRRFYPFFPGLMAKVRRSFTWNGYRFPKDRVVMLDLIGTNQHIDLWRNASEFRPERFAGEWSGGPFSFIPQGGGQHARHHRCPGEWITVAIMKSVAIFLANDIRYNVPDASLQLDLTRVPPMPANRFVIQQIQFDDKKAPASAVGGT